MTTRVINVPVTQMIRPVGRRKKGPSTQTVVSSLVIAGSLGALTGAIYAASTQIVPVVEPVTHPTTQPAATVTISATPKMPLTTRKLDTVDTKRPSHVRKSVVKSSTTPKTARKVPAVVVPSATRTTVPTSIPTSIPTSSQPLVTQPASGCIPPVCWTTPTEPIE